MPLDGALITCLRAEFSEILEGYIEKIHLPAKNEFVLSVRSKVGNKKLYISINPESPRVCFTTKSFENPTTPPMFCMLLRKHLSSGKIVAVEGLSAERIVIFKVLSTNELGDKVLYKLIIELLGHQTNLLLVNEQGKILDAARRSDIESATRILAPGAEYKFPEADQRFDLFEGDLEAAAKKTVDSELPLNINLIKNIRGLSPLICREISYRLSDSTDTLSNNIDEDKLLNALEEIKSAALSGGKPYIICDKAGLYKDFSFIPIRQYGNLCTLKSFENYSDMLETFYETRDKARRLDHLKSDILKLLKNLIARNNKKLNVRREELKKSENREELRIFGELLKANLYRIEKGATSVLVENYYDPECKPIKIKLNPTLSPQNNAAKYFKDYKKACSAGQTLLSLIEQCENEAEYLNSVLYATENAETSAEISEIRLELKENGYISYKKNEAKQKKKTAPQFLWFEKNGFKIAVGRNNIQNDILTLKTADKNDLWFHTKNIHGSHVILFLEGKTPDDETLIYAASLAAKYSAAKNSSQVPVDYTPVKYVKKPAGAKTGMVIYKTNKTIFADPKLAD